MSAPDVSGYTPYVGWLYVTDATLPNPYDRLPPYLADIARQLSAAISPSKGEYAVTTRKSRAPIPFVQQSFLIRSLGSVSDSKTSPFTDVFAVQQNVGAVPGGQVGGWQNVLQAYPDHLKWRYDLIDASGAKIQQQKEVAILDMNCDFLRQGFVEVEFFTGLQGGQGQFFISMAIRTVDGIEQIRLERMIPGDHVADIQSAYVTPCGEGNSSQATFGAISASVTSTSVPVGGTIPGVDDLEAIFVPFQEGGESVPFLNTLEGNNLYQTVTVDNGVQTTAEVFVGSWM